MKWFSIFPILALAFLANACERHPAAELPAEGQTAFGEHAAHHGEEKTEAKPAAEAPAAKAETPAAPVATSEAKSEEAPKFFPDKK